MSKRKSKDVPEDISTPVTPYSFVRDDDVLLRLLVAEDERVQRLIEMPGSENATVLDTQATTIGRARRCLMTIN